METGESKENTRPSSMDGLKRLPADLVAECRQISREIRQGKDKIRDTKVIAARIRIETDYYDSDNVLRIVASRMLDEGENG
jgi:hypothetical protein